jgi:hypothetical protein
MTPKQEEKNKIARIRKELAAEKNAGVCFTTTAVN